MRIAANVLLAIALCWNSRNIAFIFVKNGNTIEVVSYRQSSTAVETLLSTWMTSWGIDDRELIDNDSPSDAIDASIWCSREPTSIPNKFEWTFDCEKRCETGHETVREGDTFCRRGCIQPMWLLVRVDSTPDSHPRVNVFRVFFLSLSYVIFIFFCF